MTDRTALHALVDEERARFDVPGCSVAVVKDGEVLLAEGFGTRDLVAVSRRARPRPCCRHPGLGR